MDYGLWIPAWERKMGRELHATHRTCLDRDRQDTACTLPLQYQFSLIRRRHHDFFYLF
jgi:hypothetical protein